MVQPSDDLRPALSRSSLSEEILRGRREQAERDAADRLVYEPRAVARIDAHRRALDALERFHQRIADATNLDLVGDTEPAAIWQMAGRCISIGRLTLDVAALGYTDEVLIVARSLHEASRLLEVFTFESERPLLERWLEDKDGSWVRPSEVRRGIERVELEIKRRHSEMKPTAHLSKSIYAQLSEGPHHRRRYVENNVAPQLRTMMRGPEANWPRRATAIVGACDVVEETVHHVGAAFCVFYGGPPYYESWVRPLLDQLEAIRREQPLLRGHPRG